MRAILCVIFVFVILTSFGQTKETSVDQPLYFLDSVKVNLTQLYFDSNKIESINIVDRQDTHFKAGIFYFKSKNPKDFNFITLADIKAIYLKSAAASVLFMIDNKILKDDISTYKIDSDYILNVEVLKSTEINSLNKISSLAIISIKLKTKENIDKTMVHIRGTKDLSEN